MTSMQEEQKSFTRMHDEKHTFRLLDPSLDGGFDG